MKIVPAILYIFSVQMPVFTTSEKISPTCDMKQYEGYYQIKSHKIKKPTLSVTKTTIKITELQEEIEVLYAKRRWLTIYCYDGSSIDPNTGCYESITLVNPSCSQLREWEAKGNCPTGWECRPDGECTGASANRKCFDRSTITTRRGPSTLKWEGSRYFLFPLHTCVSSWECNKFKTKVDIFAQLDNEGNARWIFYDKDNREHEINSNMFNQGEVNPTEEILCLESMPSRPTVSISDANCYAESEINIKCIVTSNNTHNGVVFDISRSGFGILRHMKIEVMGPLLVPKDGKIIDLNKGRLNKYDGENVFLLNRQRAVNVETAHELAISATVLQMQSMYNIVSLSQEVDEIYNMMIELIKSQSISDPRILSRILKKQDFAIKWSNENIFEKCKCTNKLADSDSNCYEDRMYQFGSYVENNDKSRCYHIPPDAIINISLIENKDLKADFIKYLPPQQASSDSSNWDALNDSRNSLMNDDRTSHSYDNLKDDILNLQKMVNVPSIWNIFLYATCGISWISFFTLLVVVRR